MCKILVATKLDLSDDRIVGTEKGQELAKKFGMEFIEVSAKENQNIKEAF